MFETSLPLYLFSFYFLQSYSIPTLHQSATSTFGEPVVHEIPVVLEVTISRVSRADSLDVVVAPEEPISQPQVYHYLTFYFLFSADHHFDTCLL